MGDEPRALTEEECRRAFLDHARALVDYWRTAPIPAEFAGDATRYRLEGVAFSLLVALDGGAAGLPAFRVVPQPHPDDRAFHEAEGANWWPDDLDIAGALHEEFHRG